MNWIKENILNSTFPLFFETIDLKKALEKSKIVVQVLYYFFVYFAVRQVMFIQALKRSENYYPSWPIEWWANNFTYNDVALIVQVGLLVSAFLGAFFYKRVWARVLVFFSYFQLFGFFNSFEQVDHIWYHWFYALFFLMFLPNVWSKTTKKKSQSFLTLFWGAQALVMLSYTMAGIEKIQKAVQEFVVGKVSLFSSDSISLLVAFWTARRGELNILSEWIISHPIIAWLCMLTGVYVLTFALVAAFRPRLHMVWGVLLVLFHLGTYFAVGIVFYPSIALMVFLLWMSPFKPDSFLIKDTLHDLPVFGDIWDAYNVIIKQQYEK